MLAPRGPDVDLLRGTVRVRAAMQKVAGEWRFVEPKSDNGRRAVVLSPLEVVDLEGQGLGRPLLGEAADAMQRALRS